MKVLLIDTALTGHHITYLKALAEVIDDAAVVLPEYVSDLDCRQHIVSGDYYTLKKLFRYFRWCRAVRKVVRKEKPDIVHFVYGDGFYRVFGLLLNYMCQGAKKIITFHHIKRNMVRDLAYKRMSKIIDAFVTHTKSLEADLNVIGVSNVVHIEYPQFSKICDIPQEQALNCLGIRDHKKRYYLPSVEPGSIRA